MSKYHLTLTRNTDISGEDYTIHTKLDYDFDGTAAEHVCFLLDKYKDLFEIEGMNAMTVHDDDGIFIKGAFGSDYDAWAGWLFHERVSQNPDCYRKIDL